MKHLMKHLIHRFPMIIVCAVGLLFMALFAACTGVAAPTTTNPVTVTGTIKSVNTNNGSVIVTVNGQDVTINGLSSAQVAQLQSQVGKPYSITAIQNSDGTFTVTSGSNNITIVPGGTTPGIVPETPSANEAPGSGETAGTPAAGTISFIGKVQNVSSNSIVVSLPSGSTLSVAIVNGQTDLSDFNGTQPAAGATIKVKANANTDGTYVATKLGLTDQSDLSDPTKLNTVDYQGITTSAVGSNNVIHFTVGKKSYSFTIGTAADLSDFNNNAQSIQANQMVKVEVLFNGSNGSVTKVSLNTGQ